MLVLQESTAERSTLIIQNVLIKFLTAGLIVLCARFILIRYCFYSNSAEDAQNKQKKKPCVQSLTFSVTQCLCHIFRSLQHQSFVTVRGKAPTFFLLTSRQRSDMLVRE